MGSEFLNLNWWFRIFKWKICISFGEFGMRNWELIEKLVRLILYERWRRNSARFIDFTKKKWIEFLKLTNSNYVLLFRRMTTSFPPPKLEPNVRIGDGRVRVGLTSKNAKCGANYFSRLHGWEFLKSKWEDSIIRPKKQRTYRLGRLQKIPKHILRSG